MIFDVSNSPARNYLLHVFLFIVVYILRLIHLSLGSSFPKRVIWKYLLSIFGKQD